MGKLYKDDTESLYTLLVQHIGNSGNGSNIISKHKNSKNGRSYYLDLKGHFMTDSHNQTKLQRAENKISEATYLGEKRNWKIEDYYRIMYKPFNDLEQAGRVYALLEE